MVRAAFFTLRSRAGGRAGRACLLGASGLPCMVRAAFFRPRRRAVGTPGLHAVALRVTVTGRWLR